MMVAQQQTIHDHGLSTSFLQRLLHESDNKIPRLVGIPLSFEARKTLLDFRSYQELKCSQNSSKEGTWEREGLFPPARTTPHLTRDGFENLHRKYTKGREGRKG